MRRLIVIAAVAGRLMAASTVAETRVTAPRSTRLAQGEIVVCANAAFTSVNDVYVPAGLCATAKVVNGAFSIDLEPTPAGIKYTAKWDLDGGSPAAEQWFVPDSATPLRLRDVQMGTQVIADAWRGTWSGTVRYTAYDKVAYGGSSWIAIAGSTGVAPGTDAAKWGLLAAAAIDTIVATSPVTYDVPTRTVDCPTCVVTPLLTTLGDLPYRGSSGWTRLPAAAGWLKWTGSAFIYSTPTKTDVGLSAVTNDAQLKAADLDTDATMAANSDTKVPSQKAVKTLVATKEPANANIQAHIVDTANPHAVTKTQVGLSAVTNDAQLKAADLDTDATMAANSDTKVPSQKAVKTALDLKAGLGANTFTGNQTICATLPCTTNTGAVLRPDTGVSGMGGGLSGVRSNLTMWAGSSVPSCLSTDAPNNTCGPGGAQVNGDQLTLTSIIGLWDYFLTANLPGWTVTKTQFGTDQSGVYPLWQYTFTPQAYSKVGLLSSGQHFEPGGVLALWRFMYIALGSSDPAFAPMRSVKYVVSPAGNPWGWATIAAPNRGLNSRSVNLNHNHGYAAFWAISASSDKGSAPNSEAETVAMDALLAASGAAFLFDAHDYGTDTGAGHDIDLFVPPYILASGAASGLWPDYSAANALVEYLSTATSTTLISTNNYEASWYNTAASLGIQAFNAEGGQNFGGALHSYLGSDYMTHYVKLVGNSVLALSQLGPNEAHGIKRSDLPAPMFVPVQVLPSSVTASRVMAFRNATGEAVASSVTDNGSSVYTAEKFGAGASFSADPAAPVQASADLNAANSSNPINYHFFAHAPTAANTEIGICFGYTWTYKCNAAITHKFQGTGYGDLYFYTANSSGTWGKRLGIFASGGASLGSTTDPGSGIFNAANGFYQGGVALASTHLSDTADLIRASGSYADPSWITSLAKSKVGLGSVENTALSTWGGSTNITTIGPQTTATEWQTNTDSFGQNTASGFALVAHTNNNTNGSAEAGIAFGVSTTASVIGGAVTLERLGSGSYGNLWFYTKNSSQTFARRVGFMSSGGVNIGGSTDPGATNLSVAGTIAPLAGTNTLYRCTVAGTLRVGEFTTVSADCGTAVDTGLRVQ